MKANKILGIALLGLAGSFSAAAQTPITGAPGTMTTPGAPATPAVGTGTVVPGQPNIAVPGTVGSGTGAVSPGAVTPTGASGALYPTTGVPARTIDAGTLRSDQPAGNLPSSGSQPTRRLNRSRTTTPNSTTTTRP